MASNDYIAVSVLWLRNSQTRQLSYNIFYTEVFNEKRGTQREDRRLWASDQNFMPGSDELGIFFCGKILTAFSDRTDKSRVQMPDTFISRLMPSRHKDIKKNPLYKFCELFRNNCRFLTHVSCSPLFPHLTLKIHKKKNFTSLVCDAWYQRAKTTKTFWLKVIIHKTLPRSENIYMTSAVSPP